MIQSKWSVAVVGCGGIGGYVLELLPQVMACLMVDSLHEEYRASLMGSEGLAELPDSNPFEKLILVDGDSFTGHNALRQEATSGSKLAVQMNKVRNKDAFTVWLKETQLEGWAQYVTPQNIDEILPHRGNLVIFLGVDNHKTRYEVSKWAERQILFDNLILINGGNEKITGNVTVYQKMRGIAFDPPIYEIYPEVTGDADLRPDEVHCGIVSVSNDQTAIVNNIVASVMLNMFRKLFLNPKGGIDQKLRQKDERGNNLTSRRNEVLIDLERNQMMTLEHRATKQEEAHVELPENAEII